MPGQHGNNKEKEMEHYPDHEEKDNEHKEKYAKDDLYTSKEEAEKNAPRMGLEGSHTHVHLIDGKETIFYMPGASHDEYLKAKEEMEKDNKDEDDKDMMDKEKEKEMEDKEKEKEMQDKDKEEKMEEEDKEEKMEDEEKEKKNSQGEDCDCEEELEVCDDTCNEVKNHELEQTFNINGVEIFSTGVWNGDKYTKKDLEGMITNFDKTGFEPPLKLGHNEEQPEMKDGEPALGYVDKIYMNGNKLLADFKELPKKVYEAMKRGNYKRVSSEIYWNYKNNGSVLDRVLKAVALLGSEIPAVTNLEAIEGLYSKDTGTGEVKKHYTGKESELMETDITKEYQELQSRNKALEEQCQKANAELEEMKSKQKDARISKFVSSQKEAGRILPSFENEITALLSSATEEKVYSYTKEENKVELSQIDLVEKIVSSLPELINFAEVSVDGEYIVDRQPYTNAGDEVARRMELYQQKGKAKSPSEAMELVLKEDEQLKTDYYNQQ
tara:strand:+ start:272 stop:1759 length:1488 start_codon:yes stop_codon:yes gene_type:complete